MTEAIKKRIIHTQEAPGAIGPYSQAVETGSLLFTSGQLGLEAETGKLAEGIENQTHAAMRNIGAILRAAGLDYADIVKATIFVKELADFQMVNQAYAGYFSGDHPARSCVQAAALPLGALVEIECVAVRS